MYTHYKSLLRIPFHFRFSIIILLFYTILNVQSAQFIVTVANAFSYSMQNKKTLVRVIIDYFCVTTCLDIIYWLN